jgi:NADH-quinone oxidoreductase subunit N
LQDAQYLLTSLNKTILFFDTINIGLFFIASSFLFKLAIFPFHLWIADVYEGSSTSSSIFFSLIPKVAIFVVLIRIFEYSFYSTFYNWESCLSLLAIFSILYGSFIAIKQKKIKRLLAFSAIAHMGYVLLAFSTSTFEGLESMFFYLFVYTITGFLTWSIVLILESDFNSNNTKTIADISNFFKLNFSFSIIIAAAFFSLAGTPPFVGFYAKLSILCSVINSSAFFYAFVAFLTSVISCFYYLRIIKNSFFEKHFEWFSYINFNVLISYSLSTINFLMVGLFINPNLILSLTQRIVFLF